MEVLLQNKWIWVCIALLILEEVFRRLTPKIKGASGDFGARPREDGTEFHLRTAETNTLVSITA